MAFQPVKTKGNTIDLKLHKDKPLVGTYVGSSHFTTDVGQQVAWKFVLKNGKQVGVYGFTNLNRAMENVPEGSLCRLTYQGTKNLKTKFGMKDVHQVLVEVDDKHTEAPAGVNEESDSEEIPF